MSQSCSYDVAEKHLYILTQNAPSRSKCDIKSKVDTPFGSLQVIVGLFELSDVFVELLLDAAGLAEVVLQHGDLLVALRVLLLQLLLTRRNRKT